MPDVIRHLCFDFAPLRTNGRPSVLSVVFDPRTVGAGEKQLLEDLPGGEGRFVQYAAGIQSVLVNGVPVVADGQDCGRLPGQVLRAG